MAILEGAAKKMLREVEQQRMANHELARWVAFAFHSPKDLPPYTPLTEPEADPARQAKAAEVKRLREYGDLVRVRLRAQAQQP